MRKLATYIIVCVSLGLFGQTGHKDSLLCNTKNGKTDRLLLYNGDCYIRVLHESIAGEPMISCSFGHYRAIGDTIYFSFPDSTKGTNQYFCYCQPKGSSFKGFRLYDPSEKLPPGSIDGAYKDMFGKEISADLNQIIILTQFKAIKQRNWVIVLDEKGNRRKDAEYALCKG